MKIKVNQKDFKQALEFVSWCVSKWTLETLQWVVVEAKNWNLTIEATDLSRFISIKMRWEISEEWVILVDHKRLLDVVKVLWTDVYFVKDEIDIVKDEIDNGISRLIVSSDNNVFNLNLFDNKERIKLPEFVDKSIEFNSDEFLKWVSLVDFAIMSKGFSPVLTWMFMAVESNVLRVAWTDSFRLAEYRIEMNWDVDDFRSVIPLEMVNDIKKIWKHFDKIWFWISNNISCYFQNDLFEVKLFWQLIQHTYPDYDVEHIMPTKLTWEWTVNRLELLDAINKVTLFTKDINNLAKFDKHWDFKVIGEWDKWDATVKVDIEWEWDFKFNLNWKHLRDYLVHNDSGNIVFWFAEDWKPIMFKMQWVENYRYVIRPLI